MGGQGSPNPIPQMVKQALRSHSRRQQTQTKTPGPEPIALSTPRSYSHETRVPCHPCFPMALSSAPGPSQIHFRSCHLFANQ